MAALQPDLELARATDLQPAQLRELGIEALLLDIDNTLVGWQRTDFTPEVLAWLESMKSAGIRLYIISNTTNLRRLGRVSEILGVPHVSGAMKPARGAYQRALSALGVPPERAAMIGDQLFTDILGANRVGIYSILVPPLHPREFIGTRVTRLIERLLRAYQRTCPRK